MKEFTWVLLSAVLVLISAEARAHHDTPAPTVGQPIAAVAQNQLRLDMSMTAFDIEGIQGQYYTFAFAGQLQLGAVGLRAHAPLHRLSIGDDSSSSGVGDLTLGSNYRFELGPRLFAVTGLDVLLPTGDTTRGLGQGGAILAPFGQVALALSDEWQLFSQVGSSLSLNRRDANNPTFVEHRNDIEARGALGVVWQRARLQGGVRLLGVVPLAPSESRGQAFITTRPSVSLRVSGEFWVSAYAELPNTFSKQIEWSTGFSVLLRWDQNTRDAQRAPALISQNIGDER